MTPRTTGRPLAVVDQRQRSLSGPDQALGVNLLHQFWQDFFEPAVTDERGGGDLGEPTFNMGPLICFARIGVVLGEIAGIAGEHAIAPDILSSLDSGMKWSMPALTLPSHFIRGRPILQ